MIIILKTAVRIGDNMLSAPESNRLPINDILVYNNSSQHLVNIYYVPDILLKAFLSISHLIFLRIL